MDRDIFTQGVGQGHFIGGELGGFRRDWKWERAQMEQVDLQPPIQYLQVGVRIMCGGDRPRARCGYPMNEHIA